MEEKGFDLGEYEESLDDIAELEIRHPVTFQPTGMKLFLYSTDSDQWQQALLRIRKENARYEHRRDGIPQEKRDTDNINLLIAITANWSGFKDKGVELPFTEANARRIYGNPRLGFIRSQIDEFVSNPQNFIRK